MSARTSPSTGRPYGVTRVTRTWRIGRASVYRHRAKPNQPQRWGPVGVMPDADLVTEIRAVLGLTPFHGEGYRKVWARLRFKGIRTAKRRVMREHGLQAPGRRGRPRGPRTHDGIIRTKHVNEMWGTDLTATWTGEGQVSVMIAVDHCSAECVGIHASKRATRFEALEPIRHAVRDRFGTFAKGAAEGLKLRHDNGSQYVAHDFQAEIGFLGIESSPSFVRAPEGNGCAERFIRTLKENLLWVRSFDTVEDLRQALFDFKRRYNEEWILERHGYKTPAQVRVEQITPPAKAA